MAITKTGGGTFTGATFGAVPGVTAMSFDGESLDLIDSTDLGTANSYMTNSPADFVNSPTFSVDINYNGSFDPKLDKVVQNWTYDPAGGGLTTVFSGWVSDFNFTGDLNGKHTAKLTVQTSGKPTRTLA